MYPPFYLWAKRQNHYILTFKNCKDNFDKSIKCQFCQVCQMVTNKDIDKKNVI